MITVVTRHLGLVKYLVSQGFIPGAKVFDGGIGYCSKCGMDIAHESFGHDLPTNCRICVEILPHAGEEDLKGKDVIGVLPLELAEKANSVTVIPLNLPPEMRGKELSEEDVARYAGSPRTFIVKEI